MKIRGVRGATTVEVDEAEAVLAATRALLVAIMEANPALQPDDLGSAMFTLSPDLRAAFPAQAARELGWKHVPMICAQEIPVPGGLLRCIRVLLHWNTDLPQEAVQHVYLREAACLRSDLSEPLGK